MSHPFGARGFVIFSLVMIVSILACSITTSTSDNNAPAVDSTKAALELEATAMSLQITQDAMNAARPTSLPPQPPAATVQPTIPPAESSPTLENQAFFTEDFNNGSSNWSYFLTSGDDSNLDLYAKNGMLTFDINGRDVWAYALYDPFYYSDVQIDVSAANRGNNENNISLICRYDEKKGWYEFNVFSDGRYDILFGQWKSGQSGAAYEKLYDGGSNAIRTGMAINEYTAVCNGNSLTLYVNGTKVHTASSEFGLQKGQIGIGASSFDRYPVAVDFDWVKISQP